MFIFVFAILIVFAATGTCALIEAALYAVRQPYIHRLAESGNVAGNILQSFKDKMDFPITAILIFDTLLGIGGASIAGSQARALFGEAFVYWFTFAMAVGLLLFAQIIPKVVGVAYNQPVSRVAARPIQWAIVLLYPFVLCVEYLTRFLKPGEPKKKALEEDVSQMAKISVEEGSILGIEGELIQNSLRLNDVVARQIMTPFNEAVTIRSDATVREAFQTFKQHSFSRIPICTPESKGDWTGLVFSRDILFAMANDQFEQVISEIARPLNSVPANQAGHILLDSFLKKRVHLFAVHDQNQSSQLAIGLVTLEDVIEEILGKEIVDEKETG